MISLRLRYGSNKIPILSNNEIDAHAEMLLVDYDPGLLLQPKALDVDDFTENYLGFRLHYTYLSNKGFIWGRMVFNNAKILVFDPERNCVDEEPVEGSTIVVDNNLTDERMNHAYRSTVMHECGHGIFHDKYYYIDDKHYSRVGNNAIAHLPFTSCKANNIIGNDCKPGGFRTNIDWIEHQAKYFSAAILMPKTSMIKLCTDPYLRYGIFENHPGNENEALALFISRLFNVSTESARIRIKTLRLTYDMNI